MKGLRYIPILCALAVTLAASALNSSPAREAIVPLAGKETGEGDRLRWRSGSITKRIGPFATDRQALPVVLRLADYPQFAEAKRAQLGVYLNGKEIASQLDDLNGDGTLDELAFLIDVPAGKALTVTVKTARKHRTFEPEVHAQMFLKSKEPKDGFTPHTAEGKSFYIKPVTEQTFAPGEDSYHSMHHHGVAFESAIMAYRIYFDKKQTIDVYAKKTPRLELDACKWYPTDEQLADGFGDDILRVSGYIGVGACKPWNGKKMVHFDEQATRTQRIVSQGCIRTICEVVCEGGWGGLWTTVTTRYTLYARHRDVIAEVFSNLPQKQEGDLVTGVQKIGKPDYLTLPPSDSIHGAIVASWGTAWPVNDTVKYAKETAGLAVYVPKQFVQQCVQDANNNLVLLTASPYIKYFFTVVSLKENQPPATTDNQFFKYVELWAKELEQSGLSY